MKSHASKIVMRVDDELELGRLHDRQVGGLDAFDDLARGDRLGAPGAGIGIILICLTVNQMAYLIGITLVTRGPQAE